MIFGQCKEETQYFPAVASAFSRHATFSCKSACNLPDKFDPSENDIRLSCVPPYKQCMVNHHFNLNSAKFHCNPRMPRCIFSIPKSVSPNRRPCAIMQNGRQRNRAAALSLVTSSLPKAMGKTRRKKSSAFSCLKLRISGENKQILTCKVSFCSLCYVLSDCFIRFVISEV